ncbi:sigma-70 family RNA polymerase sigma factor [Leptobacterium sp. I13]|uniref:sigma-70 family RNA polymerase sigma factor n=1 Tax=Leptobacterium meishanense TaxID=3128904 RepID=UPI0030EE232D
MSVSTLNPNQWIDKYADYLYNYTIARVSNNEIAQDIVQDTFLAALKASKNYKGDASERTWLISILKRKIIDHYRKINSKKGKAEVLIDYNSDPDSEGNWFEEQVADSFEMNAEDTIQNEELRLAIENCLGKLPEKQARVFKMKTIEGIDTEDICNEIGITPSNLWVIIHRARTSLVSCLEQNWF